MGEVVIMNNLIYSLLVSLFLIGQTQAQCPGGNCGGGTCGGGGCDSGMCGPQGSIGMPYMGPQFGDNCPGGTCPLPGGMEPRPVSPPRPVAPRPLTQQPPAPAWNDPRVVLVRDVVGTVANGCFVSIDGNQGYVLTNRGGFTESGQKATIITANGMEYPATVSALDDKSVVVLLDKNLRGKYAYEVASQEPEIGALVQFVSSSSSVSVNVQKYDDKLCFATPGVYSPGSGGGIVDGHGRLIGCCSDRPPGSVAFPRLAALRALIARCVGLTPRPPIRVPGALPSPPQPICPPMQPCNPPGVAIPAPPSSLSPDYSGRLGDLEAAIGKLSTDKQDKGDYITKADFERLIKSQQEITDKVGGIAKGMEEYPTKDWVTRGISVDRTALEEKIKNDNNEVKKSLLETVKADMATTGSKIRQDARDEFQELAASAKEEVGGLVGRSKDAVVVAAKEKAVEVAKGAITSYLPKLGLFAMIPGAAGVGIWLLGKVAKAGWNKFKSSRGSEVRDTSTFRRETDTIRRGY